MEDKWMAQLEQLRAYAEEHGHLPKRSEEASSYITRMRQAYKGRNTGSVDGLSNQQITALEAIPGWKWSDKG